MWEPCDGSARRPSHLEGLLTSTRFLSAYYFWYFAAIGVHEPYLTPFWQHLGFSPTQVGLLNSVFPAVAVLAPFVWTAYADLTRKGEAIFLANTWITAMTALVLPNVTGLLPMAGAIFAYSVFRTPLIPLANSMAFRALVGRRQGYAAIRSWGTIGYVVTAVTVGVLVERFGLRAGLHGIGVTMVVCGVVGWMGRSRERVALSPVTVRDVVQTLQEPRLWTLLAASFLARVSVGPYTTFFTIHLAQLGHPASFAGAAWALAALSELAAMLCWSRVSRLAKMRTWLTVALGAHALRWLLFIPAENPSALLAIQLTNALTFGVFYPAAVESVDALAPEALRATAQGVFASVSFGLGGLFGNAMAGWLYEPLGMRGLYAAAAGVAAAGTILYWTGTRQPAAARQSAPWR